METVKEQYDNIIEWLTEIKVEGCNGVVLGLSGGKDSTVVAMLAKEVWGENVLALLMPNGKQIDIDDSIHIAETIHLDYRIVNIETIFNALTNVVENKIAPNKKGELDYCENCPKITAKAKTNIPPRIRMTVLYAVAQSIGYRVIGTGNASEAYIGWTTKWGDSAYDFNPIAHLTCTQVIELGKYLAAKHGLDEKYITKVPSDGLCGKTDEESFGFSYKELDEWISHENKDTNKHALDLDAKIETMHLRSEHKRRMPLTMLNKL